MHREEIKKNSWYLWLSNGEEEGGDGWDLGMYAMAKERFERSKLRLVKAEETPSKEKEGEVSDNESFTPSREGERPIGNLLNEKEQKREERFREVELIKHLRSDHIASFF